MVERFTGNMTRTGFAHVDKLTASFKAGVLEVSIPKLP
jgi:HSP20 family molecular chaperone IbpA